MYFCQQLVKLVFITLNPYLMGLPWMNCFELWLPKYGIITSSTLNWLSPVENHWQEDLFRLLKMGRTCRTEKS